MKNGQCSGRRQVANHDATVEGHSKVTVVRAHHCLTPSLLSGRKSRTVWFHPVHGWQADGLSCLGIPSHHFASGSRELGQNGALVRKRYGHLEMMATGVVERGPQDGL